MTAHAFRPFDARPQAGFTLVEIVVVLLIFAVVVGMAAMITRGVTAAQKRSLTSTRIAALDAALVQFVQQKKRLPCPAKGDRQSSDALAGLEEPDTGSGACDQIAVGVVPWRSLGLSEADATDGWYRRLTYRVPLNLTANNAMDMSSCDPAGTGPLTAGVCTSPPTCSASAPGNCTKPSLYLSGKGLEIRNLVGTTLMNPAADPPTGAAYVVISHGESGGGGYLSSGQLSVTTTTDGDREKDKNYANLPLQAYYVDDSLNDNAGANHFDDIVSRPALLSVVTKAGLGPRAH